jgi:predicted nucleic acid-binding protein
VRGIEALVVSATARVEVPAALWRKQRLGELEATQAEVLVAAFEADFLGTPDEPPRLAAVAVLSEVLDSAAELAAVHGLRAYDAVQLASARAAADADPGCDSFVCFDAELRAAAARAGFTLLPYREPYPRGN